MTMMKKILSLLACLTLLITSALAEDDLSSCAIANANVSAVRPLDVVAPFSGTLNTFDLAAGDRVSTGDVLFSLQTTGLYATEGGTVGAVFAQPGDDAQAVTERFGGIVGVEPSALLQLQCTTTGGYNSADNRHIHLGETLYFRSSKADREEGSGQVVAVSGQNYVVDIAEGDFDLSESMSVYRKDSYQQKDCVGKGTVIRRNDVLTPATGRVTAVHVSLGDTVKAGQLLAEVVSSDAGPGASPDVAAPEGGVVSSVQVSPGQQVWKGQVLCRIELDAELEVVAEVDEMDLGSLSVGDRLSVTIDMLGSRVLTGTVTEISAMGLTRQNAAYYTIHVSIPADSALLGASASVYLPKN